MAFACMNIIKYSAYIIAHLYLCRRMAVHLHVGGLCFLSILHKRLVLCTCIYVSLLYITARMSEVIVHMYFSLHHEFLFVCVEGVCDCM